MQQSLHSWDAHGYAQLRRFAKKWYLEHKRDLPWRQTADPYCIWVSEIMLQQTQVATVIPYYHRFLSSFPNVNLLAEASLDEVYHHWAGLGYYRRARQLHEAAKVIQSDYQGVFPNEFKCVRDLPGIGRYTAGAVLSFALDQRHPIVEANTQRLYARLLHLQQDPVSKEGQQHLWTFAEQILPSKSGSGTINQALMEIGSQVCLPKNPSCLICPLQVVCPTFASGSQSRIPVPKRPKEYTDLLEAALVIRNKQGHILMRRCTADERWAGLWDFPRFDVTPSRNSPSIPNAISRSVAKQFYDRFGKSILIGNKIYELKHAVTRYRITLSSYEAEMDTASTGNWNSSVERKWVKLEDLPNLALSSSGKRLTACLTRAVADE